VATADLGPHLFGFRLLLGCSLNTASSGRDPSILSCTISRLVAVVTAPLYPIQMCAEFSSDKILVKSFLVAGVASASALLAQPKQESGSIELYFVK